MSKVSGSNGKPVGLLETFKNSFLFAILYNVLAFLQAINLAVVFSPSADIDQEQEEKRQNITYKQPKQAQEQLQKPKKKPATVSSKLKKNRKQQQKTKRPSHFSQCCRMSISLSRQTHLSLHVQLLLTLLLFLSKMKKVKSTGT